MTIQLEASEYFWDTDDVMDEIRYIQQGDARTGDSHREHWIIGITEAVAHPEQPRWGERWLFKVNTITATGVWIDFTALRDNSVNYWECSWDESFPPDVVGAEIFYGKELKKLYKKPFPLNAPAPKLLLEYGKVYYAHLHEDEMLNDVYEYCNRRINIDIIKTRLRSFANGVADCNPAIIQKLEWVLAEQESTLAHGTRRWDDVVLKRRPLPMGGK